jgi:predicted Zn-dependent peptidase
MVVENILKRNFRKKVLKNGMTLIFEKRDVPVVSVAYAFRNGGVNESAEEKGISHFIEHMLYKGTPKRNAQEIAIEIEKNGGAMNGFTDEEITAYWCKMPSNKIDIALDVLTDMVKNPLFDVVELEKERKVIFEEMKMRRDNPITYVFDEIQRLLYKAPFGEPLIGTEKTMNSISRDKIHKKFKQIYTPNNTILCVVGNADFDMVVNYLEKNFSSENGKVPEYKTELKNESKIEKRKGIDQANLIFAFHTPLAGDKLSYAAKVLSCLMAEGMSSRLFREIREKRNLAYAVKGDANCNKRFGYNLIYIGTMKENVQIVKKLILEEFEKVVGGLKEEELDQIKEQLIGNYKISMEDSQAQMASLMISEIQGKAEDFYDFEKNIFNVKLKDVQNLAKKAIKEHSFLALIPENK